MKRKTNGKYILCALCGIAGGVTLVKPEKDINRYECADVLGCKARQRLASLTPNKKLCSHTTCVEAAFYICSCGMYLCSRHAKSYKLHPGHYATPLDKPEKRKDAI